MTAELQQKIKNFVDTYHIEYNDVLKYLQDASVQEKRKKCKTEAATNIDLVGRYFKIPHKDAMFPVMNRYFKVLSYQSENEYRVECLVFDEHPTYWFDINMHKAAQPGDGFLGSFTFNSFHTVSVMARDIRHIMLEITAEEYNEAARRYLDELLSMRWTPNHIRMGGKLPSDMNWEDKDK